MKQKGKKRIAAVLAAACMTASLSGCALFGGGQEEEAMTAEAYVTAFEDLTEEMPDTQAALEALDPSSGDTAEDVEGMKAPYEDFMALTPPEDYAGVHEEMQAGCQSMMDYIDAAADGADAQSAQVLLQAAVDHFAEGASLISQTEAP